MAVGNCSEIGENLSKIANRLLKNDDLVKLLYYSNADPLAGNNLTQDEKTSLIFNQLIKIIPIVKPVNDKSIVSIQITSGTINSDNDEFRDLKLQIEIFVPLNSWFISGTNLRPFAIMGEIQKSLKNKTVNGLGKISGGDFELEFLTEEVAAYLMTFDITVYE